MTSNDAGNDDNNNSNMKCRNDFGDFLLRIGFAVNEFARYLVCYINNNENCSFFLNKKGNQSDPREYNECILNIICQTAKFSVLKIKAGKEQILLRIR